jgi:hypothetical protein
MRAPPRTRDSTARMKAVTATNWRERRAAMFCPCPKELNST